LNAWTQLAGPQPAFSQRSVQEDQTRWLLACLQRNAHCAFGQTHHFSAINSVEAFQASVPIQDYESLRDPIERIGAGAADILFNGMPVAFEQTGGSTGGTRLIPYTEHSIADFRRALQQWLHTLIATHGLHDGHAYWALSPATRARAATPGGIPVGLPDAAYFGPEAGAAFARLTAVPLELATETDVIRWREHTLYWLLRCEDLAMISVWSPTFFSSLLDALPNHADRLFASLRRDDPPAAKRFESYLVSGETRYLWPHLRLVSCWADASSAPYFRALQQRIQHAHFQPKGLLSTEAVVSVPDAVDQALLTTNSGFYEFVDPHGNVRPAWQLCAGEQYDVLLTTAGGLYRYRSGDCVICQGHAGDLPILAFAGRTGITSDMVGEKLTDAFASACLTGGEGFRMLVACPDPCRYVVVHDGSLAGCLDRIEAALCHNPQYAYALKMRQLGPLEEHIMPDAVDRFTQYAIRSGRRLGDVKLTSLCLNAAWLKD